MEIENLTKEMRNYAIEHDKGKSPSQVAASWYGDDLTYSGSGKTIFIILPTSGCSWALGDSGGCTMCSYTSDTTLEPIADEDVIELFENHLNRHPYKEDYENGEKIAIKLFASGSFLNPHELSINCRDEILKIIANTKEISEIVVESRPEYIKEEIIDDIFEIIDDKLFEIAIGLETSNDNTRLNKINKGFTLKDFNDSVKLISKLNLEKGYNLKSKAYIFIKPILLNEKEAIDEAIESAAHCEKTGVSRISFCPATIHSKTLIERMWRNGSYKAPWIWSTIEVINTVRSNFKIPALLDTSGFGSRRGPYNCKKCNKDLKHEIIKSNLNQSIIDFDCECKSEWIGEVKHSNMNYSKTFIKHLPLY
ncbi:archaeosine biosynthesis radical SAM protein RaSEA [Methanobrevibacter sp. DSM 116169]|uniref:archaeosine biosynthesis radical SAM protein RaSEA n=1 Tax=Methanobrevibacter sp. DSM 116169 TaxID=3242727 RepID=UPI0038FCA45B